MSVDEQALGGEKGKQRAQTIDPASQSDCVLVSGRPVATPQRPGMSSLVNVQTPSTRHVINRKAAPVDAKTLQYRNVHIKEQQLRGRRAQRSTGQTADLVNVGHYASHDPIYFPGDENERLYTFQKDGIRFLWNVVVSAKNRGGALLAHTMGMGKTRQVITLLGIITETANSPNAKLSSQIPAELRNMRALIVAPAGLLENWREEIIKWGFESLNPVRIVSAEASRQVKVDEIKRWAAEGTVLLIGYETFLKMTTSQEYLEDGISDVLFKKPTIVVADEAHRIKNPKAKISIQFQRFETLSRVAMTGSPLSNNLLEYYHIMRWADEIYAGDEDHFNTLFALPIRDGLYADSLPEEVKISNLRQKLLIKIWDSKMHRVNVGTIKDVKDMLPPKIEFRITMPLMPLQLKIYKKLVEKVRCNESLAM
ncbi:hypothetical protein ABW21_db0209638 [Orbilia brochopaga]|nr:hypothetical protein ABW21_db0209638 [Drechslerella brochopaga]